MTFMNTHLAKMTEKYLMQILTAFSSVYYYHFHSWKKCKIFNHGSAKNHVGRHVNPKNHVGRHVNPKNHVGRHVNPTHTG